MAVSIERLNPYINLDRYPIHEPDSRAGQALIAQAKRRELWLAF